MARDDEEERRARAARLREQIEELNEPKPEGEGAESPREFVHKRMREEREAEERDDEH